MLQFICNIKALLFNIALLCSQITRVIAVLVCYCTAKHSNYLDNCLMLAQNFFYQHSSPFFALCLSLNLFVLRIVIKFNVTLKQKIYEY